MAALEPERSHSESQPARVPSSSGGGGGVPPIFPRPSLFPLVLAGLAWGGFYTVWSWGLRAVAVFVLYLVLLGVTAWFVGKLIALLPLQPTWANHAKFARFIRPAPVVIIFVLVTTNYLPTSWIREIYTKRIFVSYLDSLLAICYQGMYMLGRPRVMIVESATSRPALRYVMSVTGAVSVAIMAFLVLTLVPASFEKSPEEWWTIFWPAR